MRSDAVNSIRITSFHILPCPRCSSAVLRSHPPHFDILYRAVSGAEYGSAVRHLDVGEPGPQPPDAAPGHALAVVPAITRMISIGSTKHGSILGFVGSCLKSNILHITKKFIALHFVQEGFIHSLQQRSD